MYVNAIRPGCKDVWNAFMVKGAAFTSNDIPLCPTTAREIPKDLISYQRAKILYNKHTRAGHTDFFIDKFVHFYIDDYLFDSGRASIWLHYEEAYRILSHFAGIITPDFSTYADFPFPIKIYNTYRMRAFGYWIGQHGMQVINNVRWGTAETYSYCFDGLPQHSIISLGVVASQLRTPCFRTIFLDGLCKMLEILNPSDIIIYGAISHPDILGCLHEQKLHCFDSETSLRFQGVSSHEQTHKWTFLRYNRCKQSCFHKQSTAYA